MIERKKRTTLKASLGPVLHLLRDFGPLFGAMTAKLTAKRDFGDVDHLDDRLRRDVGLPPRTTRKRPYPEHFKPPPFL
ncbi:MAG: hypothetical protein AAFQ79_04520 [Pseudomonadota bacterium]